MSTITPQQNLNLQRWILALRTTTIPQAKGKLFRFEPGRAGACCLGIACEAFQVPFEIVNNDHKQYTIAKDGIFLETDEQLPATVLMSTFGLSSRDQKMLIELNDDKKWTFVQIADWLEQFRQASLGNGPFPANPLQPQDEG